MHIYLYFVKFVYIIRSSFLQAKFLKAGDTLARNPLEKAHPDGQPFNPSTPVKCCEEGGKRTDSLEQTPSRLLVSFVLNLFHADIE